MPIKILLMQDRLPKSSSPLISAPVQCSSVQPVPLDLISSSLAQGKQCTPTSLLWANCISLSPQRSDSTVRKAGWMLEDTVPINFLSKQIANY